MDSSLVVMEKSTENEDNVEEGEDSPSTVYIIPTSHVSKSSSEEVKNKIDAIQPDTIAVELDESRFRRLTSMDIDSDLSIKKLLLSRKFSIQGKLLLSMLSLLQRNLSEKLGIDMSGIDMLAGIDAAEEYDIPVALVDQDMNKTINRFTEEVSTKELLKIIGNFGIAYIQFWRQSSENLEEQVEQENMDIQLILEEMESAFPSFKKVFIDERDEVIAKNTIDLTTEFKEIVLVIGAGHEPGVRELLEDNENIVIEEIDLLTETEEA